MNFPSHWCARVAKYKSRSVQCFGHSSSVWLQTNQRTALIRTNGTFAFRYHHTGRSSLVAATAAALFLKCKNVGIQVLLNFNTARFGMDGMGKRVTHPSSTRVASGEMYVCRMGTLQAWWFVLNFLMPNDSQISRFALQRPSSAVIKIKWLCGPHWEVKSCLEWHAYKNYYTKEFPKELLSMARYSPLGIF